MIRKSCWLQMVWTSNKNKKKEVSVLDDADAKALKKALDEEPNIVIDALFE